MRLAARAASIFQVADVPLVEAVLVDVACAVAIALVALERDEWYGFGFFGCDCCGAGERVVVSVGSRGICATVGDSPLALSFFRGGYWRVNSSVVEADAASVGILEFFFELFSFSLVAVLCRFFNIFL